MAIHTIDASSAQPLISRGLVNLLTPQPNVQDDIFGAAVRILVLVLQRPSASPQATLGDLSPFLSRVLDSQNTLVPDAVRALQRIITADGGYRRGNCSRSSWP